VREGFVPVFRSVIAVPVESVGVPLPTLPSAVVAPISAFPASHV
jgi:hypothetical protein